VIFDGVSAIHTCDGIFSLNNLELLSDTSILLFYFLIYSWIIFGLDCIVVMKDALINL